MIWRLSSGLVLALASSAAINWGYFVQHGSAAQAVRLSLRHPWRSLRALFGDLRWLTGFTVGLAGWALYVAALTLAPLSLVQASAAGGIVLLAFLVARHTETGLLPLERVGVVLGLVGLVLLGASLAGGSGGGNGGSATAIWIWIGVSGAVAALSVALLGGRLAAGASLGFAAGVLYGAVDVATKATVTGWRFVFVLPLVVSSVLGFVCLQLGFQRGRTFATAGVATLLTNALPIAAGLTVFHEHLPGGFEGVLRGISFAIVTVAAAVLMAERPPPS